MSIDTETTRLLRERREELRQAGLDAVYAGSPGLWEHFGEEGRDRFRENVGSHVDYLAASLRYDAPELFAYYVEWLRTLFIGLGLPAGLMQKTLDIIFAALAEALPPESAAVLMEFADRVKASYRSDAAGSGLGKAYSPGEDAAVFLRALLACDREAAKALIVDKIRSGTSMAAIYLEIFQASQYELGRRWHDGTISVAEEHYCSAATQVIMSQIQGMVPAAPRNGRRLVAAAVEGDFHEIGIRMIAELLELDGWDSYFLGANCPPASVVSALLGRQAGLLCLSVTVPYNLIALESTILLAREATPEGGVKIMVGGSPFNTLPDLWRRMGADAYAVDADRARDYAASLIGDAP
jgi:methanogenic corrinoid protein MtbC1